MEQGLSLNPKYPGGMAHLKRRLAAEGHRFVRKGTRTYVAGFEHRLEPPSRLSP
jgi:hypothetical protein